MSRSRSLALALAVVLFGAVPPGLALGPPATFRGELGVYGLWLGSYSLAVETMAVGATAEGTVGFVSEGDSGGGCGPAHAGEPQTFDVATAASSAPEVLRVTLGPGAHIRLDGLAEGTAVLSLLDHTGALVDRFTITVRAATTIDESLSRVGTDVLLEGGQTADVVLPQLPGRDLAALPLVDAVASGALSLVAGRKDQVGTRQTVWLTGTAGFGHLVLTVPGGARAERDLYIAPASRVASVTLRVEGAPRLAGGVWVVTVVSTATLDDGRKVMGPRCDYGTEGPEATVTERALDGAAVLERRADVRLEAKGVYQITCRLGAGSATAITERP